ncbi:MAG: hypothetical protein IIW17_04795 [Clostridia bacterium]|nr:hypothetical protein [Clostridia bacterium]MBQ5362484.1 hypothetical protein [Clostridia bacterium]MBQ5793317.1 hypothetical protein [Clostridia bacterium]
MKKIFWAVWTAVCTVWVSMVCTCPISASEQMSRATERVLFTMDVYQTVCIIIVITAIVLFVAFHIAKAVLKKMLVSPDDKDEDDKKQDEKNK